ncbi:MULTISPECIES: DJ-1 family glyoxalase III [Psychrilyobacter]|uniref:DJ-1/PfpI family protein n=1 Tax=Psychrilyobacter piezotolerans TaxID=2293438 RepID=A0ABX9KIW8_9FUSO|nr:MULTISPECIES: DJ-1 family glyoxalase III [Psychrilyobacter]MCS5421111.1 DJ-1/PfpI family protein [Psychrilyobacter sp. S5]NDI77117.1 DJ-1/PfpI family protein [Psychrilyobacter piezotolerans]RDE64116.1 DJ-1/PfpI family protein [Psychrilyobacter sp. S5]REI42208.1 DJ-1/PfpI family protein [Psychrilyobacter piezotolerans]
MKKAAVYLAEGFEEIEALTTADILRRAEIEVDLVAVGGNLQVAGAHNIKVIADILIEEISHENYDMMVLPGGMPGTLNLDSSKILKKQIIDFDLESKYIGAICAAPLIIGKMGFLEDRQATCYPGVESQLFGAAYRDDLDVIVDGNFITSRGPGTAMAFGLKLVELLKGKEISENLASDLLV